MNIGEKIRVFRGIKGYSQESFAEMLEMSVAGYAQIERNETDVKYSRLEQIAEKLEIPVADLITFGDKGSYSIHSFNVHTPTNGIVTGQITNFHHSNDLQQIKHDIEKLQLINEKMQMELSYLKELMQKQ